MKNVWEGGGAGLSLIFRIYIYWLLYILLYIYIYIIYLIHIIISYKSPSVKCVGGGRSWSFSSHLPTNQLLRHRHLDFTSDDLLFLTKSYIFGKKKVANTTSTFSIDRHYTPSGAKLSFKSLFLQPL